MIKWRERTGAAGRLELESCWHRQRWLTCGSVAGQNRSMGDRYRPEEYWSERLNSNCNLRGTGHISYSAEYNAWLYRAKRRALLNAVKGMHRPFRALDVGSGIGWVVQELLECGAEVEGCDIASVAVARLRQTFPDIEFFQATLGSSPLPRVDHSYDVITLLDVAYHITDDAMWRAGLTDLARLLQPNGRLVVSDGLGSDMRAPASHVRFRSRAEWEREAAAVGLSLLQIRPYFRWLSRDRDQRVLGRIPDRWRGAVEYGLERIVPRPAHMHCAVFTAAPS